MNEQQISLYQAIGQSLGELCEEELNAVPPRAQLHRICGSLSGLDRRIRSALRQQRAERERRAFRPRQVSWKGAKRAGLLAAVLMALFLGLLTVSADMRAFLKRTIAIWTGPNVDIRYEVDGHKLTELPEGYAPHYIPEGFSYNENNSFAMGNETIFDYENKEGHFIQITIRIAENASLTSMDTEHTNFKKIDYGEGGAYLGTFEDGDGYTMYWFADGIEHELYISAALKEDEVFKIADGIYS